MYGERLLLVSNAVPKNVQEDVGETGVRVMDLHNYTTNMSSENISDFDMGNDDYIFDRTDVRATFITLYSIVFCCCVFGNLLVIFVVTLSRRLRSITNFFLANLAVADLCVGIFCVFQNLTNYLITSWVLGDFLCKMYQFVQSLSYTASIFILIVICTERYFAIIHPITCKQILTSTRLRLVILGVWITSAAYSAPKFLWFGTMSNYLADGHEEIYCIPDRQKYNSEIFDMVNFGLLYVTPLCVMTVLYSRIAVGLWRSSHGLHHPVPVQCCAAKCSRTDKSITANTESIPVQTPKTKETEYENTAKEERSTKLCRKHEVCKCHHTSHLTHLSHHVLRARRGVVRMLIVVVLTFAVCNLPFHARKMWQYWSKDYEGTSDFSALLTPITFLITYFNSAINPFLYAFLSKNFRKGMKELLICKCDIKRRSENLMLMNPIGGRGLRRSSTRSTRANCSTVTVPPNGES